MNPLKFKHYHPTKPKQKAKASRTADGGAQRHVLSRTSAQPTPYDVGGSLPTVSRDIVSDFAPGEDIKSIEQIMDEVMRSSSHDANIIPVAEVPLRDYSSQAFSDTFFLAEESMYRFAEANALAKGKPSVQPIFEASAAITAVSKTMAGETSRPNSRPPLDFGLPECSRRDTDLTSQAPPGLALVLDEENITTPYSGSIKNGSNRTSPGLSYEIEFPGDTLQTMNSARSKASRLQGTANITPASSVEDADMEENVRRVRAALEGGRSTTYRNSNPIRSLPPSPATTVEVPHLDCDGPLHVPSSPITDITVLPGTGHLHPPKKTQDSEIGTASCDVSVGAATSPSPPCSQDATRSPFETLKARSSRRLAKKDAVNYDDESDSDNSMDSADGREDDTCSPRSESELLGGDEHPPSKRRRLSIPAVKKLHSKAPRGGQPRRTGSISTPMKRLAKAKEHHMAGVARGASSGSSTSSIELAAIFAKCSEWPLQNASLKCTLERGKPVLQLQFELPPLHEFDNHGASNRAESISAQVLGSARRAPSSRASYTPSEDSLLLELKSQSLPWTKIHQLFCEKFPARTVGSLSGHYWAKLKPRLKS